VSEYVALREGEYLPLWRKVVAEGVVISLERLKGTPALRVRVWHRGRVVWESGTFFSKRSFSVEGKHWERIAAELEREGVPAMKLVKPEEWLKLLEEARKQVPDTVMMPKLEELKPPTPVSVEELAKRADRYLYEAVEARCVVVGRSEIALAPVAVHEEGEDGLVRAFDWSRPQDSLNLVLMKVKGEPLDKASFFIYKLQDELGSEGLQFTAFTLGVEPTKSRRVLVRGVVVEQKMRMSSRPILLATEVEPLNEVVERFTPTADALKQITPLKPASYEDLLEKVDRAIAPEIVGRAFEKLVLALTWCSPLEMRVRDRCEQGLLRTLFFGDTSTGKSTIAKFMPEVLGLGVYVPAESASRAGLLYTVETSVEPPMLIWGRLVLADREAAVLDGIDRLPASEWMQFREALSTGRVIVSKRVKGEAPFRVRIVACANPMRKMNLYATPVEAVKDIPVFHGRDAGAAIRRFDLFVPFSESDVSYDDIAEAKLRAVRDRELMELFRKLVLCSWRTTAVFKDEALARLVSVAKELLGYARALDIPVVHNAFTDVVLKVAGAFACLLQKFLIDSEGLKAVVDEEVCGYVERFFEDYVERLGVREYAATLSTAVREDQIAKAIEQLKKDGLLERAVLELYKGKMSKSQLGAKLGVRGHDKQQELVDRLSNLGLVEAKRGVGVYLAPLGRAVAARLFMDYHASVNGRETPENVNTQGGGVNLVPSESPPGERITKELEVDSPTSQRTIHSGLGLPGAPGDNVSVPLEKYSKDVKKRVEQSEAVARVLEYVGREGKPLAELYAFVVKELKILKPEPLLRDLFERGLLIKVEKGGERWVVRG